MLGLSVPYPRHAATPTAHRVDARYAVLCRAVGSVLASHCYMRTVDFELILCRQVGDKFLLVIELSGFPTYISQQSARSLTVCICVCVCGEGEGVSAAQGKFRGGGMITKKIPPPQKKTKKNQALFTVKDRNL